MKPTILITDTLFISPKYEERLVAAGFAVERLANPKATEEELVAALKDKVGYIIGGTEAVTDTVIQAADSLKALSFTGSDWANFIPGHIAATQKGIAITNTPGTTKFAVSEFTIALLLMMLRHTLELGGPGDKTFLTSRSLANVHIGIVGLGNIGTEVARMLTTLGAAKVSYWDRQQKPTVEQELGIGYLPLEELFAQCDVVSNHLLSHAGQLITAALIKHSKDDALFINTGAANTYDMDALYEHLTTRNGRAAFDTHVAKDERFQALPLSKWYITNANTGFNTQQMLDSTDDMATTSIINVLTTGEDQYIANR
jgi:phosphoglycerate dehydrogenase-like enzyme